MGVAARELVVEARGGTPSRSAGGPEELEDEEVMAERLVEDRADVPVA